MVQNLTKQKGISYLRCCCLWLLTFLFFPTAQAAPTSADSTVMVAAGKHYLRSGFHRFWWGKHYRKVWAEPVAAPYFWISQFQGGVMPLKEGGSFQTKNLRLVDSAGREYVLRSVDKDPSKALPKNLQKTFIAKLMRDQTSVIHPYGAFIVPALAQAAGVYHTNPRLVYIADDPALGEFRKDFAHMLALLEERPDGNWENQQSFGKPQNILSSRNAFQELIKSSDYQVDRQRYLLSRLFDMWLSDWSRREDQWRWSVFKKGEVTELAPIPRDRDHAFFKFNDGALTKLVSVIKPNYQSFDKTIKERNVKGLIRSSSQMDGFFLGYLTQDDFQKAALKLQENLTDQVIEKALQGWSPQIRELSSQEFGAKLKSRRDDLPKAAATFYRILNQEVLLPGTDAPDSFQLNFREDGSLLVQHFAVHKNKKRTLIHEKVFLPSETKKLSIFGLGDEDTFVLQGKGNNKIMVQLYGGEGTDGLSANPSFQLSGQKILLFDEEDGNDYPKTKGVEREEYTPAAQEFNGTGWLLRHRLH
ncbi:hypothetical protein [Rufibacter hautae]|uniref:Uncharacterized protein n=1 Tax=Rufibacter hautae TaxID=2595005 RepID=A0A5B6TNU3_9BACT|nr:hypothetical protein [Rufibacter hautae]KAA3438073.1 hypothetical protein FOA19_12430 [Rufibacter hautae]